jgi:microcystin-dependent protein
MAEPFTGQIEAFAFNFAPRNWLPCNGQLLQVRQYQALAALLGKTFGGDGVTNFGLPELRGCVPLGGVPQARYYPGLLGGEESHQLTLNEIPSHNHDLMASSKDDAHLATDTAGPTVVLAPTLAANYQGRQLPLPLYVANSTSAAKGPDNAIGLTGGQAHENRMPGLALNFCICTNGVIPSPG